MTHPDRRRGRTLASSSAQVRPPHRPGRGRPGHQEAVPAQAARRRPHRLPRRGRLPGRAAHARPAVQAVAGLRRCSSYPWVQVPAGEIGVVIAQVGEPLPIGAKSAVYNAGVRQLRRPAAASSPAAARRACSARCCLRARLRADPPGGVHRDHRPRGVRPARRRPTWPSLGRRRPARRRESFGLTPEQLAGRRHRARRATSTWSASSPRSRARRSTRATSPPGSAASTTSPRWRPTRTTTDAELIDAAARLEERPAQQLPGLPGVPRRRRPHRPAARPAALRRLPAQPVPGAGRAGADARRQPGRGRRHQGLRRPAHARHVGRRVQVRLDRPPRPPRHLAGAAAHRQVRHQPARLRGRDRARRSSSP